MKRIQILSLAEHDQRSIYRECNYIAYLNFVSSSREEASKVRSGLTNIAVTVMLFQIRPVSASDLNLRALFIRRERWHE